MTQDEIIRMALETGLIEVFSQYGDMHMNQAKPELLERFAALVAANEAKEHLKMLENLREETKAHCLQAMAEAYEMGKQDEREACAKVLESGVLGHAECAAVIRARSE